PGGTVVVRRQLRIGHEVEREEPHGDPPVRLLDPAVTLLPLPARSSLVRNTRRAGPSEPEWREPAYPPRYDAQFRASTGATPEAGFSTPRARLAGGRGAPRVG